MLKDENKPLTDRQKQKLAKQKEKERKQREKEKAAKEKDKKRKEREKKRKEKEKKAKEREKKRKEKEKAAKEREKLKKERTTETKSVKKPKAEKRTKTDQTVEVLDSKKVTGELVGKVYDVHDSPMAQVLVSRRKTFVFSSSRTGKAVESKNLGELTRTLYLSATDGEKFLNIRWARNSKFDIRQYTRPWGDTKPHWSASRPWS